VPLTANTLFLKRALLFFWALWFSIAAITNIMDGLKAVAFLPNPWPLASGNYAFIVDTMHAYDPPRWLTASLFLGVIAWECLTAFLLWQACKQFRGIDQQGLTAVYRAFTVGLGLWASFIIADEIFIAYEIEHTHRQLFILQLLSLLGLRLLPDEAPQSNPPH